jgi:hypothetical protein
MYRNLRALSVFTNLFNFLYIRVYLTADRTGTIFNNFFSVAYHTFRNTIVLRSNVEENGGSLFKKFYRMAEENHKNCHRIWSIGRGLKLRSPPPSE